jgi:hypothetical protein
MATPSADESILSHCAWKVLRCGSGQSRDDGRAERESSWDDGQQRRRHIPEFRLRIRDPELRQSPQSLDVLFFDFATFLSPRGLAFLPARGAHSGVPVTSLRFLC